jgi:hypothetical protein
MNDYQDWEQEDGEPCATIDGTEDGARYVTITSSGIKEEGAPYLGQFITQEVALDFLHEQLRSYFAGKKRIWWRRHPTTTEQNIMYFETWQGMDGKLASVVPKSGTLFTATCRVYAE